MTAIQIATTAQMQAAVDALIAGAPGALDTLNELAAALGDDQNFAASVTTALGNRLNYRGAWAATTAYATNDLVMHNGGAYRALAAFTSGGAFVAANWENLSPEIGTYASLTKAGQEALLTQKSIALQPWYAALANRWYVRPNYVHLGNSITEGQGATAFANRWMSRLAANLRAAFPVGSIPGGRGHISTTPSGETSFTWPVTSTLNAVHTGSLGAKRWNSLLSAAGHTATFSLHGTSADIMYTRGTGAAMFSWSVDGGAATNQSTQGASVADGKLLRVALGASGDHTLTINWVSGSCNVHGVIEYDGDENAGPPMVHDVGHYGYKSSDWAAAPFDPVANWPASIAALSPHLIGIEIGTNDLNASTPAATVQANITTTIGALRAAVPNVPVVLIAIYARNTFQAQWPAYVAAMYAIAAADPLTVVCDMSLRMPYDGTDTLGLYADGVHASNKGQAMMADIDARFVMPV